MIKYEEIIEYISLKKRYMELCKAYSDELKPHFKSNIKELKIVVSDLGKDFEYFPEEKYFKATEVANNYSIQFGLKLHDGIIETFINILNDQKWIIFNRIDFLLESLDPEFPRSKCNVLYYTTYQELSDILNQLFEILEDFKAEFLKQANEREIE